MRGENMADNAVMLQRFELLYTVPDDYYGVKKSSKKLGEVPFGQVFRLKM